MRRLLLVSMTPLLTTPLLFTLLSSGCGSSSGSSPGAPAGPTPDAATTAPASDAGSATPDATAVDADAVDANTAGEPGACKLPLAGKVTLPADDGLHTSEPSEWWYWTGHLRSAEGRWFGFEEVFFRSKVLGQPAHMVHSALTDVQGGVFHHVSKTEPGDLSAKPSAFDFDYASQTARGGDGHDWLHAQGDSYTFDLELTALKRPVLQHDAGYKAYDFGGYTYYYSRERMEAKGTITLDGVSIPVTGTGWFDRQYGDLGALVQGGWNWFAIQLDDQRELMVFVSRSGGKETLLGASLTGPDCVTREIQADQLTITSLGTWQSPHTLCIYPAGWTVKVEGMTLDVQPLVDDQEVYTSTPIYWEGASSVTGSATGRAYVELVGYCPLP